jgi:hypothetical protein
VSENPCGCSNESYCARCVPEVSRLRERVRVLERLESEALATAARLTERVVALEADLATAELRLSIVSDEHAAGCECAACNSCLCCHTDAPPCGCPTCAALRPASPDAKRQRPGHHLGCQCHRCLPSPDGRGGEVCEHRETLRAESGAETCRACGKELEWHGCRDERGHSFSDGVCTVPWCGYSLGGRP